MKRVIVFTRTKHAPTRSPNILSSPVTPPMPFTATNRKTRVSAHWKDFAPDAREFLSRQTLPARGIDIDDVTHVVNLNCPMSRNPMYTGSDARRAPAAAASLLRFCDPSERDSLRSIEKL